MDPEAVRQPMSTDVRRCSHHSASRESDAGHPSCSATSWERQAGLYFLTYEVGVAPSTSEVTPRSKLSAGETPELQAFSSFLGTTVAAAFWYDS